MTDAELIAALRKRPYDRAAREAARRLEELVQQPDDNDSLGGPSDYIRKNWPSDLVINTKP